MIKNMVKTVLKNITIQDVMEAINKKYGEKTPALKMYMKDGSYRSVSYVELGKRCVDISASLIKEGLEKNDRVAIYSESRPEWAMAFFGIISCAGITVPIDVKLSEREVQFILNDSGARFIFVSSRYLSVVEGLKDVLPNVKKVIVLDDEPGEGRLVLKDMQIRRGDQKYMAILPEDTAMIVYTSGTTGVAKGVEISYRNLLFQVTAISDVIHYSTNDRFISILPLNHMLEVTGGLIAPLYGGACIIYSDTIKPTNLVAIMKENKVTAMICVPLLLKIFHDGIMKRVDKLPQGEKNMFYIMLNLSKFLLRFNIRAGKVLFKKVHYEFGGAVRGFISGGAPLNIDVEIGLNALGFRILQGYGLTETSPVVSVNTLTHARFGSVGRPLNEVEVKIIKSDPNARDGEVAVCGPNLMKGYYKNPEKTDEVVKNGWFYTGDIGYVDSDGFLFISGRLKNLIVLGAGKKIFPEEVEEVMGHSPYIKEICVLGKMMEDGPRKGCEQVYAVVVPNPDNFKPEEKTDDAKVREKIKSELNRLSADLAEYKRITGFEVWKDELPKTATRKIKRNIVNDMVNKSRKTV